MKLCNKCNERPVRGLKQYTCSVCHNDYQKKWYKNNPSSNRASLKRRKLAIRTLILEAKKKPCLDCGHTYPYYVMDFDHVRGKKKYNLSECGQKMYSLQTIQEEIDKCDVVCSNCHRERTFSRIKINLLMDSVIGNTPVSETGDSRIVP